MKSTWTTLTTQYDTEFACKEWPQVCPNKVTGTYQMATSSIGYTYVNFKATLNSDYNIGIYKEDKVNYLGFSYGWNEKGETLNSRIASYGCFWQPKERKIPKADWTQEEKIKYSKAKYLPYLVKRSIMDSAERILIT